MKRSHMLDLAKSVTILVILSLGLFLPGLVSAQPATTISVSAPERVKTGEQFVVDIVVEPGVAIAGVQSDLAFDPSLVMVDSVNEGNLLSQGGAATFFRSDSIDNEAGSIDGVAGAIITPGQTVSTTATFAIITVTAGTSGGTCLLTLSGVIVGDINGQPVEVSIVNDQVVINQSPLLDTIGSRSVNEGEIIGFTILANDTSGEMLTYSAYDLPDGASFAPDTRTFFWIPRYDQAEDYVVRFEVSDGELTDFEDVTINVIQQYQDWDVNGDELANVLDMILVGQHWDEAGLTGWIREDTNEDGAIGEDDMIIIGLNWTG